MEKLLQKIAKLIEGYEQKSGTIVGASMLDSGDPRRRQNQEYIFDGEKFTKKSLVLKYTEQDVAAAYERGLKEMDDLTTYLTDSV